MSSAAQSYSHSNHPQVIDTHHLPTPTASSAIPLANRNASAVKPSPTDSGYPSPPLMESSSKLSANNLSFHSPIPIPISHPSRSPPVSSTLADDDLLAYRRTLESELPDVTAADLVPMAEVVDAVVKDVYKRMMELGEVLPSLHDGARAGEIFQFALYARRQIVKLLALVRWSQESEVVAKCLNVIGFLNRQNNEFDQSISQLSAVKSGLGTTRLRNPDTLTALDVLSTGTYRRLPKRYQLDFEPEPPLSKATIRTVLTDLNELIAYRLKAIEVVPIQMKNYRIADGRVYFTCPGSFQASFCLLGAQLPLEIDSDEQRFIKNELGKNGGEWYPLDLEFSFGVGGRDSAEDVKKLFPTNPGKPTFEEIRRTAILQLQPSPDSLPSSGPSTLLTSSVDISGGPFVPSELSNGLNSPAPTSSAFDGSGGSEAKVVLSSGLENGSTKSEKVLDAPLVRVFNLLHSLSLAYQLEILYHQAQRIQSLGWVDCFNMEMDKDRRSFKISYWPRQRRTAVPSSTTNLTITTSIAGTLTISLSSLSSPPHRSSSVLTPMLSPTVSSSLAARSTMNRVLNEIETNVKSALSPSINSDARNTARVSDKVLDVGLKTTWEMEKKWSGGVDLASVLESRKEALIDPTNLDLEKTLLDSLKTHANHLIKAFHKKVIDHPMNSVIFDLPGGDIVLAERDPGSLILQVRIHGKQFIHVFVDPRSGKINLRDSDDVISSTGESTLQQLTARLNENPTPSALNDVLMRLKFSTIRDTLTQKLQYLGFAIVRNLPLKQGELIKFGTAVQFLIYVPLPCALNHYFVTIMTPADFRFALVSVRTVVEGGQRWMVVDQIGFFDRENIVSRMRDDSANDFPASEILGKRKRTGSQPGRLQTVEPTRFNVDVEDLRRLYRYCIARVTSHRVESQLKARHVPYDLASRPSHASSLPSRKGKRRADEKSGSSDSVIPIIVVQASDLLRSNLSSAEVAMPNVSFQVSNWWKDEKTQIITSFKLRHRLGLPQDTQTKLHSLGTVFIDPISSVVNIVTEDIDRCVDSFIEEFSMIGKLAAIANEVKLLNMPDLQMTHFDLHTARFVYAPGLAVSVGWKVGLPPSLSQGSYNLSFETLPSSGPTPSTTDVKSELPSTKHLVKQNPHANITNFFERRLNESGRFADCFFLLRATLPFLETSDKLLSVPSPKPGLQIKLWPRSISTFCFLYQKGNVRYGFTYAVLPNRQDRRYLIQDSSRPSTLSSNALQPSHQPPPSNQPTTRPRFTPIPNLIDLMEQARSTAFDRYPKGLIRPKGHKQGQAVAAPVVVLGPEEGLVCTVECVGTVLEVLHQQAIALLDS
ncbi:Thyroid hormone receptor-associated coactivator complex component (TRAP170) [Phaffia rhodozyma]|uniref:Mediator of RNA polymerase II transcription subunit 14 n=1 Tax=Phaffia rhodozyma TaxID=264483 RepID=A0A0F7SH86_PHARH|nr:Thyroid hormone receptor-associated coactivator complex component (TRAP170) [Phaffia rhodozyma]